MIKVILDLHGAQDIIGHQGHKMALIIVGE